MTRRLHFGYLFVGPVIGLGLVAAVMVAVLGVATPAAPQQPEPLRVRSGSPDFDLGNTVVVTNRVSGPLAFTDTATLTLTTYGTWTRAELNGGDDAVVSVAVPPEQVGDLLAAIAGRAVVVSMRMPDNYCRPDRERTPVAQPDTSVNVAAR